MPARKRLTQAQAEAAIFAANRDAHRPYWCGECGNDWPQCCCEPWQLPSTPDAERAERSEGYPRDLSRQQGAQLPAQPDDDHTA